MRWTTQTIVILGLAASLTFQVGRSSAEPLPGPTVGESLSADELEKITDTIEKVPEAIKEKDGEEPAESNGNHVYNDEKEVSNEVFKLLEERLEQIREKLHAESKKTEKIAVTGLVKQVAAVWRRLHRLRQEAESILEISGVTKIGSMAKKVVDEVAEALKKVREATTVKGGNKRGSQKKLSEPTGVNDSETLNDEDDSDEDEEVKAGQRAEAIKAKLIEEDKQTLEKLRQAVKEIVGNFKQSNKTKPEALHLLDRLRSIGSRVHSINFLREHTEIGPIVNEILREISAATHYIRSEVFGDLGDIEQSD